MKKTLIFFAVILTVLALSVSCGRSKTTASPETTAVPSPLPTEASQTPTGTPSETASPTETPTATETPTVTETPTETPVPVIEGAEVQIDGRTVTLTVSLPDCAGLRVSAILRKVLPDKTVDKTDAGIIDLGQMTLGEEGEGSLALTLREAGEHCVLTLTAPTGIFEKEVNRQ